MYEQSKLLKGSEFHRCDEHVVILHEQGETATGDLVVLGCDFGCTYSYQSGIGFRHLPDFYPVRDFGSACSCILWPKPSPSSPGPF